MRDDSIEDSEEMRVDPIDVATLNMGRKGMARNGRQFAPLECGANDTLNYGEYVVIETPKFGKRKYKNRYSCEWNLVIPASSNLWFSCEFFDVKKGDYLYLAEMPLYGYSDTGFYMEPVTSPEYDVSVTLRFETNRRRRGWGFRCYVDSEEKSFSPNATVSGWGTLSSGGNQPTVLNEVDVTVQSNAQCQSSYGSSITSNMLCAADAGKDSCQGDSGGPLVAQENGKYALIGVVSWGYGCAFSGYPGVYARVTEKMDWILANTSGTQLSSCAAAAAGR